MQETIDTNGQYSDSDIPDGTYDFEIVSLVKRYKNDKPLYSMKVKYEGIGGEQVLFPNQMGGFLKVLGCTETEKGKFEWDPELMVGKTFKATVKHVPDKKNPSKVYQNMVDFSASKNEDEVQF